jgi:hypothetical protein
MMDGTGSMHRGINMLKGITVIRCRRTWSDNIKAYLVKVVVFHDCGWIEKPPVRFCGLLLWTQCGERRAMYGCRNHRRGPHFKLYNSHGDFLIGSHIRFRSFGMWRGVDGWVLLSERSWNRLTSFSKVLHEELLTCSTGRPDSTHT